MREQLVFLILFVGFTIGGWFIIKVFWKGTRLPIAKQLDELGGAVLGLVFAALSIVMTLVVMDTFFLSAPDAAVTTTPSSRPNPALTSTGASRRTSMARSGGDSVNETGGGGGGDASVGASTATTRWTGRAIGSRSGTTSSGIRGLVLRGPIQPVCTIGTPCDE